MITRNEITRNLLAAIGNLNSQEVYIGMIEDLLDGESKEAAKHYIALSRRSVDLITLSLETLRDRVTYNQVDNAR